jgi:indolepyruvate ferredoxin oxidoreductase alpha subunit
MCPGCSHRGVFYVLSKKKLTVHGDIGCYALGAAAPLNAMDTTVCMGASISGLHGFMRAGGKNAVCVIGDSTFTHMGLGGLVDIAYNNSDSTVIILDNSTTAMTGHQENPTTGYNIRGEKSGKVDIEAICRALGIERVRVIDPYDLEACEAVVTEELASPGPSVIIARRPCTLLKTTKPKPPLTVDKEKCTGCAVCMRIGCPAISNREKKAGIDHTLCVGCGICAQLCKFGALVDSSK